MQHIKTYDEALNEGLLDNPFVNKIKEFFFPSVYRIRYSVKQNAPNEKEKMRFRAITRYFDIKAKSQTKAEEKFENMVSSMTAKMDNPPDVDIITIYKTKKLEHKKIKLD